MKKIIIKLSLIIIPFILLIFVFNSLYKHSFYWKNKREQSKFLYVPNDIKIANLGSSQGICAFYYEDFPEYTCFNFAVKWQHNKYNYFVLKQYINHFESGAVLLIPIAYFEITRVEKDVYEYYYGVLKRENFPDWNIKDYLKRQVFPVLSTNDVWGKLLMTEKKSPLIFPPRVPISKEDLFVQTEGAFSAWTDNTEAEQGEYGFEYNIEMISRIIDLCHDNCIIPILVSIPQIHTLNDKYSEIGFFDNYYRFINVLQQKYQDVKFWDYSHDANYSYDTSLFGDATHLNIYGVKMFTSQIMQDLKSEGLLD